MGCVAFSTQRIAFAAAVVSAISLLATLAYLVTVVDLQVKVSWAAHPMGQAGGWPRDRKNTVEPMRMHETGGDAQALRDTRLNLTASRARTFGSAVKTEDARARSVTVDLRVCSGTTRHSHNIKKGFGNSWAKLNISKKLRYVRRSNAHPLDYIRVVLPSFQRNFSIKTTSQCIITAFDCSHEQ